MWGRSQCSQENAKYYLIEPIVAQGFTARVVTLFYTAMRCKGYLIASSRDFFKRIDHITDAIGSLTLDQFLELIKDVRLTAFILDAWNSNSSNKQPHNDIKFRTMCRMLQEVKLFLLKDLIQSYYLIVQLTARPFCLPVPCCNPNHVAYSKIRLPPMLICLLFH